STALALLLSQATRAQTVTRGGAVPATASPRAGDASRGARSVRRAGGVPRGVAPWRARRGRRFLFLLLVPACPGIARGRLAAVVGDVEAAALEDDSDGVNNAANGA